MVKIGLNCFFLTPYQIRNDKRRVLSVFYCRGFFTLGNLVPEMISSSIVSRDDFAQKKCFVRFTGMPLPGTKKTKRQTIYFLLCTFQICFLPKSDEAQYSKTTVQHTVWKSNKTYVFFHFFFLPKGNKIAFVG